MNDTLRSYSVWRSRLLVLILGLAGLVSLCAEARLIPCDSPGRVESYKVFVDEVTMSPGVPVSAAWLKDLKGLRDFFVSDLSTLTAGQVSVRQCDARIPRDAGDFDDMEVNSLDNLRVLLEVWGTAEDPARGLLGFVLVPAWKLAPPAVYVIRTDRSSFLNQARHATELRVFAPLALGIRKYQNRQYDEAISPLCQGGRELEKVLAGAPQPSETQLRTDESALLSNVRKLISDAITKARLTPGNRYLLLKPQADGQFSCPKTGAVP